MTNATADDRCDAAVDAARVYVGNLTPKANETHIAEAFVQFGAILSVWVARKPPGFAFVEFESKSDALRAVQSYDDAHPLEILGKRVKVQLAGEKTAKPSSSQKTSDRRDTLPHETRSRHREISIAEARGRSRSRSRSQSANRRRRHERGSPRRRRQHSRNHSASPHRRRKWSDGSQQRRRSRSRSRSRRRSSRSRSSRRHSASRRRGSRSRSRRRSRSQSRSTSRSRRYY